jgi:hypothetical protein
MDRAFHRYASPFALCAVIALLLAGCGDDARPPSRSEAGVPPSAAGAPPPAIGEGPVPSSHTPVTATEHQTFERLYTEQCVKSQQDNPDTAIRNDQELGVVCDCMAKEISKRISKADALHFNVKKEFPMEVVMMTNAAANHCMSQNQ